MNSMDGTAPRANAIARGRPDSPSASTSRSGSAPPSEATSGSPSEDLAAGAVDLDRAITDLCAYAVALEAEDVRLRTLSDAADAGAPDAAQQRVMLHELEEQLAALRVTVRALIAEAEARSVPAVATGASEAA